MPPEACACLYWAVLPLLVLLALDGRQVVDLNSGWEFARVPSRPSVWTGADAVPTSGWRVAAVDSQETTGENASAEKAFDGKPETFWHTEWSRRQAPFPHVLTLDLGVPTEAVGFRLLPRQTGPQNGRPNHIRVFLDDAKVWEGAAPNSSDLFQASFPRAKGRTLKVEFVDGHRDDPFVVVAEIGLIRPARQGSDWASQYNVTDILTGDGRFDLSPTEVDKLRRAETSAIKRWSSATLPHAAWTRPLNDPEIWQGVAYYRRELPAPPTGKRTALELQGMQSMDLWLNGKWLAGRRGGYLPLRTEIREGGDLMVRVDNSDNPLIPPGKPQSQLDFMYGNGLIGNATLETKELTYIADALDENGGVRVDPPVLTAGKAVFTVRTGLRSDDPRSRSFIFRQTLFDPNGRKVWEGARSFLMRGKSADHITQQAEVARPKLWSPDSPTLYRLRTSLEQHGRVFDSQDSRVGLRTIEVSRERGLVLNGKPLRLVGTNRHQDYPWVGPAIPDNAQRRDAMLIKQSGHNIVRLSHYNQSPAFLDACDELGILTIPCIPGWQFINRDPRFAERVLRDIRETVRRDRNHPSVAWWEASLNETYPNAAIARTWHEAAKAEGANLTAGDDGKDAPWDIAYNGWRDADFSRPSSPVKPGYVREYGDYEFGGGSSTSRVRISAGMDRLLQETWNHVWSYNRLRPQYPSTMGVGTWEMFDHNVPWDFSVSASGLADIMRREKPSFWFYASQAARTPYLRIAADWQPGPAKRNVVVFTNASSATLYVNGKKIATESASRGPATPYDLKKAFNGTNTANLPHPPIVFRNVPFSAGELKVVGSNGAVSKERTAGKPARLLVWIADMGVPVKPNDLVFVRAAVVDANGVICPHESREVKFSGAEFAGEDHAPCEMGVASVLVRLKDGRTPTIQATSGTLKSDRRSPERQQP